MHVDQVTLSDLEIFRDAAGGGGVAALFVQTETASGRTALHRRLRSPASDIDEIRGVQEAVRFFAGAWTRPLASLGIVETVQRYLRSNIDLGSHFGALEHMGRAMWFSIWDRGLCRELVDGVAACSKLFTDCERLAKALADSAAPPAVAALAKRLTEIPESIGSLPRAPSTYRAMQLDRLLRGEGRELMQDLLQCLAELDALRAMGATTRELGWTLPEFIESESFVLEGEGLYHPFVEHGTRNPVLIQGGEPVVFLTGPNMAGKTTYMRAVGLVVLLAQAGMGVPAARLRMTPVEVLLTGLNPSDNLRAGLSFFFAEVLRVKEAAEHLAAGRRSFVLFDEVFKGTNVKDALEASSAVISGFARSRESGCVFSSHLVELADPLAGLGRVRFYHFEGDVVDGRAHYSYELRPGVSYQRFGLQLLEDANVPALLEQIGQ